MRKYFQITIVLSAFFLLAFVKNQKGNDDDNHIVTLPTKTASSQDKLTKPTLAKDLYKNGTYAGSLEDAVYGDYKVSAVISGGKLEDVILVIYPSDNRTSVSINTQAFERLKDEAIKVQGAQVDIVTGASDSSPAFARSLASALGKAKP